MLVAASIFDSTGGLREAAGGVAAPLKYWGMGLGCYMP